MFKGLGRIVMAVLLVMVGFKAIKGSIAFAGVMLLIAVILVATALPAFRAPSQSLAKPKDR